MNGSSTFLLYAQDTWQVDRVWTLTPGSASIATGTTCRRRRTATTFYPVEPNFPEVDNLADFNNWGPRSARPTTSAERKTVIKGNVGLYRNSPGPSRLNPNPSLGEKEYNWVIGNTTGAFKSASRTATRPTPPAA